MEKRQFTKIREVVCGKRQYLPLLLLADEQEDMIERYLDRGRMYVWEEEEVKAECVVTDEGAGILEIKNIAVAPSCQGQGFGRKMMDFLEETYQGQYRILQVGTGESPSTLPFYEKCGFQYSHRIQNFFTEHYNHPIWEAGILLTDMVYLRKTLPEKAAEPSGFSTE